MSGIDRDRLERVAGLAERYLSGVLTEADHAQFERMVLRDPAAAQALVVYMKQAGTLREVFSAEGKAFHAREGLLSGDVLEAFEILQAAADDTDIVDVTQLLADEASQNHSDAPRHTTEDLLSAAVYIFRHTVSRRATVYAGIAAALILGATLLFVFMGSPGPEQPPTRLVSPDTPPAETIATITDQNDARWADGEHVIGSRLREGQALILRSGFVEITTDRGARVILEAPCEVTWAGDHALRLERGRLFGICETPRSKGFTVRTEHASIVDLGTRFGVQVAPGGDSEVHVYSGSVAVRPATGTLGNRTLASGQSVALVNNGTKFHPVDHDPLAFVADTRPDPQENAARGAYRRWSEYSRGLSQRDDLFAYYTFDEDANRPGVVRNLARTSRGMLDGKLEGDRGEPRWARGRWPGKGALRFDRASRHAVRVPFDSARYFDQAFTAVMWMNFDDLAVSQHFLNHIDLEARGGMSLGFNGTAITAFAPGSLFLFKNKLIGGFNHRFRQVPGLRPNEWVCIAVTTDGKQTKYYLNGELFAGYDDDRPMHHSKADMMIGGTQKEHINEQAFGGLIDEVALFRSVLSGDEIEEIYNAGKP